MAKKSSGKGGGNSGLNSPHVMDPGTGPGQDGFNIPSHTTTYKDGECSDGEVGHEEPWVDHRYGGKGKK